MKILRNTTIIAVTILTLVIVGWEALLLTIFSTTQEFWFSGIALSAALVMFAIGLVFRDIARKRQSMGASLFFSLCATLILLTHFGSKEVGEYVARMEIALPQWHFDAFTYASMAFSLFPAALLLKKKADPAGTDNDRAAPVCG
jgi:hypothetical protein